jgi:hypothetical protein
MLGILVFRNVPTLNLVIVNKSNKYCPVEIHIDQAFQNIFLPDLDVLKSRIRAKIIRIRNTVSQKSPRKKPLTVECFTMQASCLMDKGEEEVTHTLDLLPGQR